MMTDIKHPLLKSHKTTFQKLMQELHQEMTSIEKEFDRKHRTVDEQKQAMRNKVESIQAEVNKKESKSLVKRKWFPSFS